MGPEAHGDRALSPWASYEPPLARVAQGLQLSTATAGVTQRTQNWRKLTQKIRANWKNLTQKTRNFARPLRANQWADPDVAQWKLGLRAEI